MGEGYEMYVVIPLIVVSAMGIVVMVLLYLQGSRKESVMATRMKRVMGKGGPVVDSDMKQFKVRKPKKKRVVSFGEENLSYVYAAGIALVLFLLNYFVVMPHISDELLKKVLLFVPLVIFVIVPFVYKTVLRTNKEKAIMGALPIIIDLLIISLGAGMSFSASIAKVVEEIEDKSAYMANRFRLMLAELNAGVDKKTALNNVVKRCDNHPVLKSFVSAIIQSEVFGFSIVQTLQVQVKEVRGKTRAKVRAKMAKVPVMLLFPLVFCIFPLIFVLLVGPGFVQIIKALG